MQDTEHLLQQGGEIVLNGRQKHDAVIHYLGVGGLLIDYGNSRIYTAPFYSDPSILRALPLIPMKADTTCIDQSFPNHLTDASHENTAVVVGHSHYDHLMDLPPLLNKQLSKTQVYGSLTTRRLVNRSLGKSCDDDSRTTLAIPGQTAAFGNIRVQPVASHHAPHLLGITAMTGEASCNGNAPKTAWGWKMGQVLAYIIDFLDSEGHIDFRVFYQDSASDDAMLELEQLEPAADVAIIVMAGFHEVNNYPASIVRTTKADLFIAGHWEDFFSGCDQWAPLITRGTNALDFIQALETAIAEHAPTARWRMLYPEKALTIHFEGN